MALPLAAIPVPLRLTDGGIMRIGQTRVMLEVFITALNEGLSTEDLIAEFPEVAAHDVFALLSYYAAHQAAVDAYVEERAAALDSLRDDPAYRAQASRWTELRRRDAAGPKAE
jgi:uncharacterized protein (DUF433 family)